MGQNFYYFCELCITSPILYFMVEYRILDIITRVFWHFVDNLSLILGLAIGIPVFFLLTFIVALVCILMKKNRKSRRLKEEEDWLGNNLYNK